MWGLKVLCLACILAQVLGRLVLVTECDISALKLFSFFDGIGIGIDIGKVSDLVSKNFGIGKEFRNRF